MVSYGFIIVIALSFLLFCRGVSCFWASKDRILRINNMALRKEHLSGFEGAKISEIAFCRFLGTFLCISAIIVALFAFGFECQVMWLWVVSGIVFVLIQLAYFIYIRVWFPTSNHFRDR